MTNFSQMQSLVVVKLFQNYCCSFYGCFMEGRWWMFLKHICTDWTEAVRTVWHFPVPTCMMCTLNGQYHIFDQFNVRVVKFYNLMYICMTVFLYMNKWLIIIIMTTKFDLWKCYVVLWYLCVYLCAEYINAQVSFYV